jgi:hypothetical protein
VSDDVELHSYLEIRVLRRTPEVSSSPRGWGEGAVEYVRVERDDEEHLLVTDVGGDTVYRVSREAIEAVYDWMKHDELG